MVDAGRYLVRTPGYVAEAMPTPESICLLKYNPNWAEIWYFGAKTWKLISLPALAQIPGYVTAWQYNHHNPCPYYYASEGSKLASLSIVPSPGLCPEFSSLDPKNALANAQLGLERAEEGLGVAMVTWPTVTAPSYKPPPSYTTSICHHLEYCCPLNTAAHERLCESTTKSHSVDHRCSGSD